MDIVKLLLLSMLTVKIYSIPLSGAHPQLQGDSEISTEMRTRRSYDGELYFPDNYDYQFSDAGDFFDDYPSLQDSQYAQKRYSDAMATDMQSRLERMKLLKARNKFLQMIMGKKTGNSLDGLVQMLRERRGNQDKSVDKALEELKRHHLITRDAKLEDIQQVDDTKDKYRTKRHVEGIYMRRTGIIARLQAEARRRLLFDDYFKTELETPEFLREMIRQQS